MTKTVTINNLLDNENAQTTLSLKKAGPRRTWNRNTHEYENLPPKTDSTIMHIKIEDPTTGLKYEIKQNVTKVTPEFQNGGIGLKRVTIELDGKMKL